MNIINGTAENNILTGTDEADRIYGLEGDDILDGGAGEDYLVGGFGNDTYKFGLGSGQDYVEDNDATPGNLDTVQLGSGIAKTDVIISRDTDNLYVNIAGTADQLTFLKWFTSNDYKIEQVKFDDGTLWDAAHLIAITHVPTDGHDYLTGDTGANDLSGKKGDDTYIVDNPGDVVKEEPNQGYDTVKAGISYTLPAEVENLILTGNAAINGTGNKLNNEITGNNADNILDGGAGDDYFNGGDGNDTYMFGYGSGQDIVYDYNSAPGDIDSVQLGAGIAPTDVTISQDISNDLIIKINGTTDKLAVFNWFDDDAFKIEQVKFADGTLWDVATLLANNKGLAPTLTAFAAPIASGNENSQITLSFTNLQSQGNEADDDGTVTAFVIKAISSGALTIGGSAQAATAWAAGTNDVVDADHQAYWTPANNANGILNAFTVLAKDNKGLESATPIQATVAVAAVNDVHTGTVSLQGSTIVGQTLIASHTLADLDGLGAVNYQWQASTDGSNWSAINGATASSLQLTRAQAGQFIRVHASYTDGGGTLESQDSAAGNKVTAPYQVIPGTHGNDALAGTTADDGINGGFGFDTVRETGTLSDYSISQSGNSVVLTNNLTGERDVLTDIERVTFDSGNNLTIAYTEAEAVARHLLTNWLHRDLSPDEGAYVLQHLTANSATDIAKVFLTLPEASGLANKSAAELLAGYESDPLMQRLSAQREVTGGDSNDRGTLPFGVAVNIDGGQGHDVLNLLENHADIGVIANGDILGLSRHADGAMMDLKNVEMIALANDETIAIAHDQIEGILGRLVHTFFDRNASVEEWQLGRDALAQHIAPDDILNWFQDHAGLTQLSDSDYIQTLYQNTFNRAATASEQNDYLTQLQNGSLDRSWLAVDLAQSEEAVTIIGSQVVVVDGW